MFSPTSVGAQTYGFGTSPPGTVSYAAASAIAKVLNEVADFNIRVQPYSGTTQALPLLNTGELDFAFSNTLEARAAINGTEPFVGHPNPKIRLTGILFPLRVAYFVRTNSDIRSFDDLKGKRLASGYNSQAIIKIVSGTLLASVNLGDGDYRVVPTSNIIRAAGDFEAGKIDAFFFSLGSGMVAQVNAKVGGVRALAMPDTPETLARIHATFPEAYLTTVAPQTRYPTITETIKVFTFDYTLLASADMADDVVYRLTQAIHTNKQRLAKAFSGLNEFDPDRMFVPGIIPYHPGAEAYFRNVEASTHAPGN